MTLAIVLVVRERGGSYGQAGALRYKWHVYTFIVDRLSRAVKSRTVLWQRESASE
jgi:hypothetical protein